MRTLLLFVAVLMLLSQPSRAQDDNVALVKVLEGTAFAVQGDDRVTLSVGQPISRNDVVETASGTVGLTFRDGTRISIGPNSRIAFKRFEFAPDEGRLAFLIRIFKGTMLYVSGVIAKLAPDAVKVETPVATVVVRGTRFLAKIEGN